MSETAVPISALTPLEAAYLTAKERSAGVVNRDQLRRRRTATEAAQRRATGEPARLRYADPDQPDLTTTAVVAL